MLARIMDELARSLGMKDKAPEHSLELPAVFEAWLGRAASSDRFVLVVDGLDELDYAPGDLELSWLPRHVPPSARLVFSTSSPRIADESSKRGWSSLSLSPFDPADRRAAISTYLGEYGKHLTQQQEARITSAPQSSNALYLSVLLGELTDQSDPESLEQAIGLYLDAPAISQLLQRVLERLEADYDGPRDHLVRDALAFLCTACRGVSESELLDLLGSNNGNPLPRAFWSPFRFAIDSFLIEKQGRLYPLHREFQNAVTARYFASEEARKLASRQLVQYFARHAEPERAAQEIPWLLRKALGSRPGDLESWLKLANALIAAQRAGEVVDVFCDLVSALPQRPQMHYDLLSGLIERGPHYAVTRRAFEDATGRSGAAAAVYYGLGLILQMARDPERALQCFRLGVAKRPEAGGGPPQYGGYLPDPGDAASG
jgi:tetratricopeptide (TPR) repeat protein